MELVQGMELAHRNAKVLKERNEKSPEVPSTSDSVPIHLNVVAQMQEESEEIDRIVRHPRTQGTSGAGRKCYRCGRGDHLAHNCIHKDTVCHNCYDTICHNCKKLGHLAKVCQSQGRSPITKNQWVEWTEGTVNLKEDTIFNVQSKTTRPCQVVVEINEQLVSMEINTGVVSREIWEARFAAKNHNSCLDNHIVVRSLSNQLLDQQKPATPSTEAIQ